MPHTIETATSGRAKCRGCGTPIGKDELRFGERLPNAFGDGEMTLWFHLECGAYTRPASFLEALAETQATIPDAPRFRETGQFGVEHPRVARINGAERAPTGRARCRSCRELIAKESWRIPLAYFEDGRFEPSGFVHAACAQEYFSTTNLLARIAHFSPDVSAEDLEDLGRALAADGP